MGENSSVQEVIEELKKGRDLEVLLQRYRWQSFEEFVGYILEQHGYEVNFHVRFASARRYEIDVLARKGKVSLAIECKRWKGRSSAPGKLKEAAKLHEERTRALSRATKENLIPVIVTLLDMDVRKLGEVFVVPIFKLNSFLLEIYEYIL